MQPLRVIIAGLFLLAAGDACAQKASVFFEIEASDNVGSRLAYSIKEGIRRSSGMQLVDQAERSFWGLSLVTLDPDQQTAQRTVYSLVWTMRLPGGTRSYVTHKVGICGSTRVAECADQIVAETDRKASDFARGLLDTLEKGLDQYEKDRQKKKPTR